MHFQNRVEAGQVLAGRLTHYKDAADVFVLALARGGVPVGYEVARELNAPLDVVTVRKLGVPGQQELAMGAIATGGIRILHDDVIRELGISQRTIDMVSDHERKELERREQMYRGERPSPAKARDYIAGRSLSIHSHLHRPRLQLRQHRAYAFYVQILIPQVYAACRVLRIK